MTILIVDTNVDIRSVLRELLQKRLTMIDRIVECSTEAEAVEAYGRIHPEWVLMDIQLADGDGLRAAYRIHAEHPDAHILMITNYDEALYREAARKAGVRAFVQKEHLEEIPVLLERVL